MATTPKGKTREKPSLRVADVAKKINCHPQTVRRMVHSNRLKAYALPGSKAMWFKPSQIAQLLNTISEYGNT